MASSTIPRDDGRRQECDKCKKILESFCITCNKEICQTCHSRFHKLSHGCHVVGITNAAQEVKSWSEKFHEELKSLHELIARSKKSLEEKERLLLQHSENIKESVHKGKMLLIERIGKHRQNILDVFNAKGLIDETQLDSSKDLIADVTSTIHDTNSVSLTSENTNLSKLRSINRSIEKVANTKRNVIQLHESLGKLPVSFRYDKVANDGTFGTLNVSLLIGGVAVFNNQLVHVFDERRMHGGVALVSIDPENPNKEHWRQVVMVDNRKHPVVMSHVPLRCKSKFYETMTSLFTALGQLYDGEDHVLFAVGVKVFIMSSFKATVLYENEKPYPPLVIENLDQDSFITSITASCKIFESSDRFLISVNGSSFLREYLVSGEALRTIDVGELASSISCIAYTENTIAILCCSHDDVILFTTDDTGKMKSSSKIPSPSKDLGPVCILWTGATWLVLFSSKGEAVMWKVLDYLPTGLLSKIHDEGQSRSIIDAPLSIARWRITAYISFAPNTVRMFINTG